MIRRLRYAAEGVAKEKLPPGAKARLKRLRELPERLRERRRERPKARREAALAEVGQLVDRPRISLVMPTYKTEEGLLREAIDSVLAQLYPEWELIVVDDGSGDPGLERVMGEYAARERRIRFEPLPENVGISAASNRGLELCGGEFVGFLDHDDTLTEDALLRVAQKLEAEPELDVVYSDSDKLDGNGVRADPFLKPDWSPVYALGAMYIGHLLVLRRELAIEVGGFDSAFDKIQDFEFMLRVSERSAWIGHIAQVLYHWRAIPGSIAAGAEEKSGVPELQARAVSQHLERRGVAAIAEPHPAIPHRALLAPRGGGSGASVSVVIASRDGGEPLRRLLASLASQRTAGPLQTIVAAPPGAAVAESAEHSLVDAGPAPYARSRANNRGAAAASGDYLLFLAEDAELLGPDSIELLLLHAGLPGVSAVGPLLVDPDGRVAEAGVAIGLEGMASPISAGTAADADGYYGSLPCAHEVSAVSSDCLLVSRAAFERSGGFEESYASRFDDYDLCQRLARQGGSTVYAPRPRVAIHRDDAARQAAVDIVDRALFVDCWFDRLQAGDPYYNPGFARARADHRPLDWRNRTDRAKLGQR